MRLGRVPALDGVRGLAVLAVLAFHAGYLQGGFLGVDLFFVLSGFLITGLLLAEHHGEGRISLRAFWARRARRLLPALLLLLIAVAAYAEWLAAPLELATIRRDGLATIFYVANWRQIVAGVSYWDAFKAPSPLEHTWSLAIEEQFYLVWPVLTMAVLRLARGSLRVLASVAVVLATASIITTQVLYPAGADTSRVYFGSDTRASSLLFGALAAIAYARRRPSTLVRSALPIVSMLTVIGVTSAWITATGTSAWLYRWGLPVTAAACAVTIYALAVGAGGGTLTAALSWRPLRHVGAISYGLYLWHWPVEVVLTTDRAHVDGLALLALHLAVDFAIAEASYHLFEMPIRGGALRGWSVRLAMPAAIGFATAAVIIATAATFVVAPPVRASGLTSAPLSIVESPRRVMVVGDSGAVFLEQGMAATGTAEIGAFGEIGCGVSRDGDGLLTPDGRMLPDPEGCHDWPARWSAEVEAFQPDVALLTIAWTGSGARMVEGELHHPCDGVFDARYRAELDLAIRTLAARGAKVLVTTTPYAIEAGATHDLVDCLNHDYRVSVASHPKARVVDLASWLCAGGACRYERDGTPLRPDGVHFQGQGAVIAGQWLLAETTRLIEEDKPSSST